LLKKARQWFFAKHYFQTFIDFKNYFVVVPLDGSKIKSMTVAPDKALRS